MKISLIKTAIASTAILSMLGFASVAFAGTGLSATPNFSTPVTVGDTAVPVSLTVGNASTADEGAVTLSSVTLVPSCGDSNPGCTTADKDVFSVSAGGTGHVGTSCAGDTFTIGVTNVTTGQVTFTRTGGPLILAFNASCQIDFTVDVLKVPTVDINLVQNGFQTAQLGAANGTSAAGNPASGTGTDITTVDKASPSISTTPSAGGVVGTILNDTASLAGGVNPTGSVTFKLYPPSQPTCSAGVAYTDADPTSPYATNPGFASNAAGVWHWTADYAGDANNNATSSPCSAEAVTITRLPSAVTTTIHDGAHNATTSVSVGTGVHDNAHVTGSGPTPTGTVVFNLYTNSGCDSATTTTNGVLSAGFAESGTTTANSALGYRAYYQGDANYDPSLGDCEPLAVTKLIPHVTTDVHNAAHGVITSAAPTDIIHDSATVTGSGPTPTGNVTFTFFTGAGAGVCDAQSSGAGVVALNGSGIADPSNTVGPLSSGTYAFRASYGGDANYIGGVVGNCEPFTITKNQPTISTTLSAVATTTGAFVHDSSILSGATATAGGSVTYTAFTNNACSAGAMDAGTKTVTNHIVPDSNALQFNVAGTFYWQAVYSGDVSNLAATSTCTEEVLTVTQPAGQYCSPGYWKQDQHFDSWVTYLPSNKFSTIFSVTPFDVGKGKKGASDPTLLEALNGNGGGLSMEARVAVDALLNSTSMNYGITTPTVISIVHNAFTNNDFSAFSQFTIPENCPLN